jgi:hypothetical protein
MGPISASLRAPATVSLPNFARESVSASLKVPEGADLDRARVVVIQHKSEYSGLFRPLWHDLSVSHGTLSHDEQIHIVPQALRP